MLAIILFSFLGFGAALAVSAIMITWLSFGSAWDALAQEMRCDRVGSSGSMFDLGSTRIRLVSSRPELRAAPRAVELTPGLFAAA